MAVRNLFSVFNRGIIGIETLLRIDVRRVTLAAEQSINWFMRRVGSMSLRPGLLRITNSYDNEQAVGIAFDYSRTDYALLELTPGTLRVLNVGTQLIAANSVTATITNGTFDTDLTGWTDDDEAGAASTWATGGYMQLIGTVYTEARRTQSVAITETSTEHRVRVTIQRGPVYFRVGTTSGEDDVFPQAVLRTGTHSLAFTPGAATIYIQFATPTTYPVLVDSIEVEAAGTMELPTPWDTVAECQSVRHDRVNDIVYCASASKQQRQIERRENNSWSVVLYAPNDGPYEPYNDDKIRITPSAISGAVTLTATRPTFKSTDVGRLYRLESVGQIVSGSFSVSGTYTDEIRITGIRGEAVFGIRTGRQFTYTISGTWTGTVIIQRSIGEPGDWKDMPGLSFTANTSGTSSDDQDNSIVYYRIGLKTAGTGTVELTLETEAGSIPGVVRVTSYTSSTVVDGVAVSPLGSTDEHEVWQAGSWSDTTGWPTAVSEYEGRLWWAGYGRLWGSVSDGFNSFDPDVVGAAAPINRSTGSGATDTVNFLMPLLRMIIGTGTVERVVRSTSLDEVITDANINIKPMANQGTLGPSVISDQQGYYVNGGATKLFELSETTGNIRTDYTPTDMMALVPDLCLNNSIVRMAVQRQPETRIWVVRQDGTCAVLTRDEIEEVVGWTEFSTPGGTGKVEDVIVLPGDIEDQVFMYVQRQINNETVRNLEVMQRLDQCRGETINRQADCATYYNGASTTTIPGLDYLKGETVSVWANGKDLGTYTVDRDTGTITLSEFVSAAWIGYTYEGTWKSAKLPIEIKTGPGIGTIKGWNSFAPVLAYTHYQGLQIGPDFTNMDNLPLVKDGADIAADTIHAYYDVAPQPWPYRATDEDVRLCLKATAPKPCTVLGVNVEVDIQT